MRQLLLIFALALPGVGQSWSGFIDPTRANDWTTSGFTIPSYTVACSTQPSLTGGAGAAAANTTAIQNALASCDGTHNVVNLPSGTYYVNGIKFPVNTSNRVLRGAGSSATYLYINGAVNCGFNASICGGPSVYADSVNNQPPSGTQQCSWTGTNGVVGTYTQGSTSIILNSCGGTPPASGIIILDQQNDTADTGGQYVCDSFSNSTCTYKTPANADGRQVGGQTYSEQVVTYATRVSGSGTGPYTYTINPPVYFNNYRTGQTPGAYWGGTVSQLGLENLTVDETNSPTPVGIFWLQCYRCWVTGVRSIKGVRNHIELMLNSGSVVRNNYLYQSKTQGSQSYGVEVAESSALLIENNIFQQLVGPTVPDAMAGSVVAYNFSVGGVGTVYMQDAYDSHNAGGGFNLWEGNEFLGFFNDTSTWGSSGAGTTLFRNQFTGWESGYTQQTNAFYINSFVRGANLIGNVLGQPNYHTVYEAYPPNSYTAAQCNQAVINLGFSNNPCTTVATVPTDTLVRNTLMRWGNYDTVNGAIRWDTTEAQPGAVLYIGGNTLADPSSHALPNSFYLSGKPSWWGSGVWPPIGPDVSSGNVGICTGTYAGARATNSSQCSGGTLSTAWAGHVNAIPAETCFLSSGGLPDGTNASVLSFDASACYPTGVVGTGFGGNVKISGNASVK